MAYLEKNHPFLQEGKVQGLTEGILYMSLKTIFNIIYQHMKQKSISCNTSQLVISPVNAKMSSGQAFTLA